jgi:hypothetical protein
MSGLLSHSGAHRGARVTLAAVVAFAVWTTPARAQTTVAPHLGAAGAWTDNITLAPPGGTSNGEVWQLLPGIYLKHDSQNLHATLDYELQEYFYSGSQHGRNTYQNGNLYADAALLPDWFFIDIGGTQSQGTVDPALSPSINTLFPTGNLANESTGLVSPAIRHKFSAVELDAQYSWGFAHYQPVGAVTQTLPNAQNQDGSFQLRNVDPNARISWGASYLRQETTYTSNVMAPRWRYEDALADLGWLVSPAVRVLAQGGKESDPREGVGHGGLGATSWAGGFDWTPDKLSQLKLTAGKRFFGKTYQARVRHQSRLLTLEASYVEQPTTNANRYQPQAPAQNLVVIPGVPTLQRLTPDVYVLKSFDARAALTGRVTEIGLELSSQQQSYLTVNGVVAATPIDDRLRGATLYIERRMGAQLQGVLIASLAHTDLREAGTAGYDDRHFTGRLNAQLGPRTTLSLTVDHWQRSGLQIFRVNLVTLNVNMTFGNGPIGAFPNAPLVPNPTPGPVLSASTAAPFMAPVAMVPATAALTATEAAGTAAVPAAP